MKPVGIRKVCFSNQICRTQIIKQLIGTVLLFVLYKFDLKNKKTFPIPTGFIHILFFSIFLKPLPYTEKKIRKPVITCLNYYIIDNWQKKCSKRKLKVIKLSIIKLIYYIDP